MTIKINNKPISLKTITEKNDFIYSLKSLSVTGGTSRLTAEHIDKILAWADSSTHVYSFDDLSNIVANLLAGKEGNVHKLTADEISTAKQRRNVHRVGKTLEPYTEDNQIALHVTAVNNVADDELLPLDHHYAEQQHRWVRTNEGLVMVKPKGDTTEETQVSAFGDPNDPSMLYYRDDRQLGHKYTATLNKTGVASNHSQDRTYGSKQSLTGKSPYKITGMVDGHAIQAQNDQVNLDRRSPYRSADRHPSNMYWENAQYGKSVRGKGIEAPVFKNKTTLLQVNEFNNYNNPTKETASNNNQYIVANTVHDLVEETDGSRSYAIFDNNKLANYSDYNYRKTTGKYKHEKQWNKKMDRLKATKKSEVSATDHVNINKQASNANFPRAQVIGDKGLSDRPSFADNIPNYDSPPGTPHYLDDDIEMSNDTVDGIAYQGRELSENQYITKVIGPEGDKHKVEKLTLKIMPSNQLKEATEKEETAVSKKRIRERQGTEQSEKRAKHVHSNSSKLTPPPLMRANTLETNTFQNSSASMSSDRMQHTSLTRAHSIVTDTYNTTETYTRPSWAKSATPEVSNTVDNSNNALPNTENFGAKPF